MAYRYTNTEKWGDAWFSSLTQLEMLLFMYLCDNCDIAGFIEINIKRWAVDLNSTSITINGGLKGLQRGLIYSNDGDCLYIRNFLKHQKNLPLQENNKAHIGIRRRFEIYANKFNIQCIEDFIEGATKGVHSPYGNGNGNGKGLGNGKEEKSDTWRTNFNIYTDELNNAVKEICDDVKWIAEQEALNPNVDIVATIKKGVAVYWGVEAEGYANKKKSRGNDLNWKSTFAKNMNKNIVWKSRGYNKPVSDIPFNENSFVKNSGLSQKSTEFKEF